MTRKRKISPRDRRPGSCTDENLEHEPVKSSNLRSEQKGERDSTGSKSDVLQEGPVLNEGAVQSDESNKKGSERETRVTFEETDGAHRQQRDGADVRRERRLLRPHSFHLLQPPHAAAPLQHTHLSPAGATRGSAWFPRSWVPPVYTSSFYVPQSCIRAPVVPLRVKKPHTPRTRALSMTLELEDRVRGWRTDKVEVIRVNERGVPQGSAIATMSFQQIPQENGGACLWPDHSSSRASVVLRRLPKSREQSRGWRRHTVMV